MKTLYLHNFACWAAARAIHNPHLSDTQTVKIRLALEKVNIQQFVLNPELLLDFPQTHEKLVNKLLKTLKWDEHSGYGAAAKIVAIYFKVTLVIGHNAPKKIAEKIYPPLDSFNLKSLGLKKLKWTNMSKSDFEEALKSLKVHCEALKINYVDFESRNTFIK